MIYSIYAHSFAEANMLYLESPIGVGFSYATDSSSDDTVNDKITGMFHQFDCSILSSKLSIKLLFLFYFSLFFFSIFLPFFSFKSCFPIVQYTPKIHVNFFFFSIFTFFWVILCSPSVTLLIYFHAKNLA